MHEFRRPSEPLLASCDPDVVNVKADDTARATLPPQHGRREVAAAGPKPRRRSSLSAEKNQRLGASAKPYGALRSSMTKPDRPNSFGA